MGVLEGRKWRATLSAEGQRRNAVSNAMQEVPEMGDEHEAMLKEFGVFVEAVETRLDKGAREYGDQSFARPPGELVGEILNELEDVCGWSFVLWRRLRSLEMGGAVARAALPDDEDVAEALLAQADVPQVSEDPFLAAERERAEGRR